MRGKRFFSCDRIEGSLSGTNVQLLAVATHERRIDLARPFRFGRVELRHLDHLVLRCQFQITADGQTHRAVGFAGENLVPKWFEKIPGRSVAEDVQALRDAVIRVCELVSGVPNLENVYLLQAFSRGAALSHMPTTAPLVAQLGVSLIERAALDAACRATGMTLGELLRSPISGVPARYAEALPPQPASHLAVRHTVGLADDLSELPLVLGRTGIRRVKVKLAGDPARDEARVAAVLAEPLVERITVDGNENYAAADAWGEALGRLAKWQDRIAWVEQPMSREIALSAEVGPLLARTPVPHVIDESDARAGDVRRAVLTCGYAGTTHKNCKGVLKSVSAAEFLGSRDHPTLFSGEDLTIVTPWSQAQDLAVAAIVGVVDVERNGHHYVDGVGCDPEVARQAVEAFPGLYDPDPVFGARLKIVDGEVDVRGALRSAFGGDFVPDGEFTTVVSQGASRCAPPE